VLAVCGVCLELLVVGSELAGWGVALTEIEELRLRMALMGGVEVDFVAAVAVEDFADSDRSRLEGADASGDATTLLLRGIELSLPFILLRRSLNDGDEASGSASTAWCLSLFKKGLFAMLSLKNLIPALSSSPLLASTVPPCPFVLRLPSPLRKLLSMCKFCSANVTIRSLPKANAKIHSIKVPTVMMTNAKPVLTNQKRSGSVRSTTCTTVRRSGSVHTPMEAVDVGNWVVSLVVTSVIWAKSDWKGVSWA